MEYVESKKRILFEVLLLVLPLSIQIYNIVASKLGLHPVGGKLVTLIILLIASLCVSLSNINICRNVENKILIAFVLFAFPALLFNLESDSEYIVYALCSVLFVPLAFVNGLIISAKVVNNGNMLWCDLLLLLPMFSVAAMMQSMPMLLIAADFGRDAILAVSIFLPLIMTTKGKYLKILLLILVSYWSIISAKRTAFLCIGIAFLFLVLSDIFSITKKSFLKVVGIVVILLSVGYYSYTKFSEFASQVDLIIERFEDPEDNASNRERTDMYQGTYDVFLSSSLFEQLFGHGYKAIEKDLYGRPTHNDLLEILYDYGVMSLVIYLLFLCKLLVRGIRSFKDNRKNVFLLFAMCNFLLLSMMNCMIMNPAFVFVNMFCLGYTLKLSQYSD
ncbi:O-antigen ligase family protein [Bacteroides nordii]|uniref:O-antigen ligase family protein n=1 Tax=Bacteroides nordii TaxID=291645 RepID=UPI00203FDC52|nr:O-antigen ligase family protein [Bacteroides nordii]GFZ41320.1 hypothetical protein BANORC5_33550 [Bacteroides nordii]